MKKQRAVTGTAKMKAILIIELASRVGNALNASPVVFPNPTPSGDELNDAATNANESFNLAQGGSVVQRNKFKTDLMNLKKMLAASCDYVNSIANGDTNKILLSGFKLSKMPEPKPAPTSVTKLDASYVNMPGQALTKWSGSKNHRYYLLQVSTDPTVESSWKEVASLTSRQHMVTNLTSGKRHYFRVIAVGTRGASVPSDMASVMVA